jgi:hypothetical protein
VKPNVFASSERINRFSLLSEEVKTEEFHYVQTLARINTRIAQSQTTIFVCGS